MIYIVTSPIVKHASCEPVTANNQSIYPSGLNNWSHHFFFNKSFTVATMTYGLSVVICETDNP